MDDTSSLTALKAQLLELGLSGDEAIAYLELLRGAKTALQLSRNTGIARTTVYRLLELLEKRSLISRVVEGDSVSFTAADPATLEVELVGREEQLRRQRNILDTLIPTLNSLQSTTNPTCIVRTYEGDEGLRQMVWHELQTKGELLAFGAGTIEDVLGEGPWAAKHRELTVRASYTIRELINTSRDVTTIKNPQFMDRYQCRIVDPEIMMLLENQIIVYNDTVALYHWRDKQRIGVEIINTIHAQLMRQIFEQCWRQGRPAPSGK